MRTVLEARGERHRHRRRGGEALPGARGGVFTQKITPDERILATVLYQRGLCSQDTLAELFTVSREVGPALAQDRYAPTRRTETARRPGRHRHRYTPELIHYAPHVVANVLNALPKSAQPGAKAALAEVYSAEDREHATKAAEAFTAEYGVKWPNAAVKINDHLDVLLEFYNYPAEHWVHLRTTNPIESTFATVRLRQRVTKGPGSRAAGVAMTFKLMESAQTRRRVVNAPHLVALVRAGARFEKGKLVERPDESGGENQAA